MLTIGVALNSHAPCMNHNNVRSRIASLISNDRTLHALRHVSRATLQAPPPNEYFIARLQKMLSAIRMSGSLAIICTAEAVYTIEAEWPLPPEFPDPFTVFRRPGDYHEGVSRNQLVQFFIPLSGHVGKAFLASTGKRPLDVDTYDPVRYDPPRFELKDRELIF